MDSVVAHQRGGGRRAMLFIGFIDHATEPIKASQNGGVRAIRRNAVV
jgi:hypothetical protein